MQKKGYFYTTILGICAVILAGEIYFLNRPDSPETTNIWTTERTLPQNLNMSAYFSGHFAHQKGNYEKALKNYLKALEKDPDNLRLLQEVYTLAMVQAEVKKILPFMENLKKMTPAPALFNYLQISEEVKQGTMNLALTQLSKPNSSGIAPLLNPLLSSWIYIKLGQHEKALNVLKELDKNKSFHFAKAYQTFLIGAYLNKNDLKQKALKEMQGKKLPAVGYFSLLKKQAETKGKWTDSDLAKQFEKMQKNYPATAELVQQFSENSLTWEKGLAEIFYFVSADSANTLISQEEALFLNSIALNLDPDKQLALIWGAELNEALDLPSLSLNYYSKLNSTNATLQFKKAVLLQQSNHPQEAFQILKSLHPKNKTNIPLLLQMAQIYLQANQSEDALNIYSQILNQNNSKLNNSELAKIYLLRANLYYQKQKNELMLADLEKAQILQPKDPMIQNDYGYNLLLNNKIEEGFKLIQQAHQQRPQDPYILDSLAVAYLLKKQPLVALTYAEKALTKMPQSALIHIHLGEIYEALNRHREAQFQYKKALDLKNDLSPEEIKKLKKKISL